MGNLGPNAPQSSRSLFKNPWLDPHIYDQKRETSGRDL